MASAASAVNIVAKFDFDEQVAEAIGHHLGYRRKATRKEIAQWIEMTVSSVLDDILTEHEEQE